MLCKNCQTIADGWPQWDGSWMSVATFKHYDSRVEVEASAKEGCHLCTQFIGSTSVHTHDYDLAFGHVKVVSTGGRGYFPQLNAKRWRLWYRLAGESNVPETIDIVAIPTTKPHDMYIDSEKSLLSTSDSLSLAREWLHTCCNGHKGCMSANPNYVPTRLLDISKEPRLRLFDSTSSPVEYASLSHCWGKLQLPTLTKSSLVEFQSRIPTAALSKTFQEAIQTARHLGLRYIWIDSLCILQDDSDDWRHESRLMTSVYGSATVNIAASGAADGSDGCFFERDSAWRCQLVGPSGMLINCFDLWAHCVLNKMPLSTRGWALQERLLPHRNLFMARTQLFWQCATSEACEILPAFPESPTKNKITGNDYLCYDGRTEISRENWSMILARYMKCEITQSKDKLVAVAGLAKFIHDETGEEYVAGLWWNDIEQQLCWQTCEPPSESKVVDYRAPSWSWASIDAEVNWSSTSRGTHECQVISANIHHKTPDDSFGEIISASLRIRCGLLLRMTVKKTGARGHVLSHNNVEMTVGIYLDRTESRKNSSRYDLYILPIFRNDCDIKGLLVRPSGCRQGEYRRIGFFLSGVAGPKEAEELFRSDVANSPDKDLFAEINTLEDGSLEKIVILI